MPINAAREVVFTSGGKADPDPWLCVIAMRIRAFRRHWHKRPQDRHTCDILWASYQVQGHPGCAGAQCDEATEA
eukprot:5823863-Alexandrium_andersonii.AAC.1